MQQGRQIKGSIRDYAYERIKKDIISLTLEPGSRISEKEWAEQLKVSRTPMREAFIKLAEEDLIDIYPQKGSFVSLIDLDQVMEARFLRETMEVTVLKLACETFKEEDSKDLDVIVARQKIYIGHRDIESMHALDEEFHRTIFEKCGKSRIWFVIQQMLGHYKRFRNLLLAVYFDWELIIRQHERIIACIRERNAAAAEEVLRLHVQTGFEKEELLRKYPNFFRTPVSDRS
jgi:DNA-binding GntR family transcriptional regulator